MAEKTPVRVAVGTFLPSATRGSKETFPVWPTGIKWKVNYYEAVKGGKLNRVPGLKYQHAKDGRKYQRDKDRTFIL